MFLTYLIERLTCNDRVERNFAYLISLVFFNTILYIYLSNSYGSFICNITSISIISLIYYIYYIQNIQIKNNIYVEISKFGIYLLLVFTGLTFFEGVNYVQRYRYSLHPNNFLWDQQLINIDSILFGTIFEKGQISLYLDTQLKYGVTSYIGKIYAEIFQLFYISYYFWGNAFGVYLLYLYFKNYMNKDKLETRLSYRLILMFLTSWVSGYLFTFMINLVFPAVSPRIYLKNEYTNEITGLLTCNWFRYALTNAAAGSFGAFPSAHSGLSWLVPIFGYRLKMYKFTYITLFAAIMVSISTLVMRYHYFIDFLAGFILVFISSMFGGFHTQKCFNKCI